MDIVVQSVKITFKFMQYISSSMIKASPIPSEKLTLFDIHGEIDYLSTNQ